MALIRSVLFLLVAGSVLSPSLASASSERTVVVMLFDGIAPVYMERFPTPAFDRMRKEGAWTHRMDPAFPTISLINGVTISTGCWPEHHGVVTNLFLDPERGVYDHSIDADWLTGCEHLHQAAERQAVSTATLGWYGRTSTEHGPLASTMPPNELTWEDYPDDAGRAEQVVEQLLRPPAERPRLILAYFKGPDGAGHFAGMDAEETRAAMIASDAAVGRVLEAVDALPDADAIQVLVTTDHGMVPVTHVVNIARILRRHDIQARALSTGTTSFLYFESEQGIGEAFEKLSTYEEFDVVRREDQPRDWHLGTGPRVGDLIVSAHPPYFIEDSASWPWFLRWLGTVGPDFLDATRSLKASHGYPTGTPGVEGILYARGSAFAPGRRVERVRAIDIHPTVMHLLDLEPGRPVDGVVAEALLR
jgi:alkaline phosphatase D